MIELLQFGGPALKTDAVMTVCHPLRTPSLSRQTLPKLGDHRRAPESVMSLDLVGESITPQVSHHST